MRILLIAFVYLFITLALIFCERDTNPLEIESARYAGLRSPKYGQNFIEKLLEGQVCRIYYSEKIPSSTGWPHAPDWIVIKSKEHLIQNFGCSYFENYFQFRSAEIIPDEARSSRNKEKFIVSFYFKISIADFSTYCTVATYYDSTGNMVRDEGVIDLASYPNPEQSFGVTDAIAVRTAQNYGLPADVIPWMITFHYRAGSINKYVWNVSIYTDNYTIRSLIIDSNKPEVLEDLIAIIVD